MEEEGRRRKEEKESKTTEVLEESKIKIPFNHGFKKCSVTQTTK